MEQGFAYLEKARAADTAHNNDRFDQLNKRFDSLERHIEHGFALLHADMRQMRGWLVRLYGLVVFGFIGGFVLILFRDFIFK